MSYAFIPQGFLDELLFIRDTFTHGYWRVGDIANELLTLAIANNQQVSSMEIQSEIGRAIGKSGRSVRLYATVSGFYPKEVRESYDILPFSHFAYAMQHREVRDGLPGWEYVLEKSMDYTTEFGMPPSVEKLSEIVANKAEEKVVANAMGNISHLEQIPESMAKPVLERDFGYPKYEFTQNQLDDIIRDMNNLVQQLPSLIAKLNTIAGVPPSILADASQINILVRRMQETIDDYNGISRGQYMPQSHTVSEF